MRRTVHEWRELTREEIERLLGKHSHGRLGLCADGQPYVVPVAYKYREGAVYFHTPKKGKKVDLLRNSSMVCFEIDEWQKGWASVICYGRVALSDDFEAKRKGLELLAGENLPDDVVRAAAVYIGAIDISDITGRCSTDFAFG